MLLDAIKDASLAARKAKLSLRANLLTTLYSEATMVGKNKGTITTDDETNKVIKKFLKNAEINFKARASTERLEEMRILKEFLLEEQLVSETDWQKIVSELIEENPSQWESVTRNPKNLGWFMGQTMKATGGKANPKAVTEYLQSILDAL